MTDQVPSKERIKAIALANRWLNEPWADPDDDLRIVARQFLRAMERLTHVELKPAHEREPPHCPSCACPPYQPE